MVFTLARDGVSGVSAKMDTLLLHLQVTKSHTAWYVWTEEETFLVNVAEAKPSRNEGEELPQAVANITLEIIKSSQTEGSNGENSAKATTA